MRKMLVLPVSGVGNRSISRCSPFANSLWSPSKSTSYQCTRGYHTVASSSSPSGSAPLAVGSGAFHPIDCVATMGTIECYEELQLFLVSLSVAESSVRPQGEELRVVVGTTTDVIARLFAEQGPLASNLSTERFEPDFSRSKASAGWPTASSGHYHMTLPGLVIEFLPILDSYAGAGIDRSAMEASPGIFFPSRHADFMMEKANIMEYALSTAPPRSYNSPSSSSSRVGGAGNTPPSDLSACGNVLFMDCDIVSFHPLPRVPAKAKFGVSPHGIASRDEALFGRYNGGWVYAADPQSLFLWRRATQRSRYFDQASLEDVVNFYRNRRWTETKTVNVSAADPHGFDGEVFEFGPQCNFGYWRLFQTERQPEEVVKDFSIAELAEGSSCSGGRSQRVLFKGRPLQSVHTHFFMPSSSKTMAVFNALVKKWLDRAVSKGSDMAHPYSHTLALLHSQRSVRIGGQH